MNLKDQTTLRVVLFEGPGSQPLPADDRLAAATLLLERGYTLTFAGGQGAVAPSDRSTFLILGRFDGGQPPDGLGAAGHIPVRIQDISQLDAAGIGEVVENTRTQSEAAKQGEWKPWFPVIDYDRCTNCMQCLSFCLFGVYGVDDQHRITVQTSENCKTNCPACSRVCPEAAIMFPKYKSGPINGDLVSDADLEREKMKIDISALLGGDVYSLLRQRSDRAKSRFSKERDSDKALQERRKCLTKLAQTADIPPEVLMSLPSPDEIARRAEEAKAKAQAALDGRKSIPNGPRSSSAPANE
jgi:Pyruvate/2-oxoacid:ferredoxin oxidoreductase delta subunit